MPQNRRWITRCKEFARKAWDIIGSQTSSEEEQRWDKKGTGRGVEKDISFQFPIAWVSSKIF